MSTAMVEATRAQKSRQSIPSPRASDSANITAELESSVEQGLTTEQTKKRLDEYGPNVLIEAPPTAIWRRLARQFKSLLVVILIVAAVISGVMGEWTETVAIITIVLLDGIIGFLQEERAERALASLRKLASPSCRVTRDGRDQSIPSAELVPGDVIHVEAGDQVSADARLLHSVRLSTQEAPLTGESTPVWKNADAVLIEATALGDRRNMLHAGTSVATGKGTAMVVATGMNTELGRIAGMLERSEREPTPLERRLSTLGGYLIITCFILIAAIFTLNVVRGHEPLEVFLFSVSLAVAAVPEGLPAFVTIALALGVRRMAKRQALVRNLPAVETLGCVTVICSDKTGTLTRNEMTVREVWTKKGSFHVTGVGYAPEGAFKYGASEGSENEKPAEVVARANPDLVRAIRIGALCNNSRLDQTDDGAWRAIGDPTEAAMRVLAKKGGIEVEGIERLHEIPFDSDRKAMSVVIRESDGQIVLYTKGAAEIILDRCSHAQYDGRIISLQTEDRDAIRSASTEMGRRALRVLALAWRPLNEAPQQVEESGLIFTGLVGMIDPPREEARPAIQRCRDAGIRPMMITGDHPETAAAVARELELIGESDGVLTGTELERLSDDDLVERIEGVAVFARVSAEHKLRIVRCLRSQDHIAAMTGDGVNDAPAVKAADIGVAMGRTGTDVTRSASDMVLLDDNFASIVAAVEEGRGIFDNIQKVTLYLLSCNAGELMLLFLAALLGWPPPLLAVQILWINLITDGVPALALAVEPPERDIMQRPPRRRHEPLISRADAMSIVAYGMLIAGVGAAGFAWFSGPKGASLEEARAATFSITAFAQLFFAVGCRSRRYTMPDIGWLTNPALFWAIAGSALLQVGVMSLPFSRTLLKTESLRIGDWVIIALMSLIPVTLVETAKLARAAIARRRAL